MIRMAGRIVLLAFVLTGACDASPARAEGEVQTPSPQPQADQRQFATPEAAADALKTALVKNDVDGLLRIFGSAYDDLVIGGDPAVARVERQRAARLFREKLEVLRDNDNRALIVAGQQAWLTPVPLVRKDGKWFFDTQAAEKEILARRIGRDELGAIAALKAFAAAQKDYAARLRKSGKPAEYARYIQSTPGRTDGLWWNSATEKIAGASPLAKFASAQREFLIGREPGDPFQGYYFRILTAQGGHAPGGAMSYFENGRMIKGFAAIAWPADYRNTGVMTFIVGGDGKVLQKDLGEDTTAIVPGLLTYDPDAGWKAAE